MCRCTAARAREAAAISDLALSPTAEASQNTEPMPARPLLRPYALAYLYQRRLRAYAVQELLAGFGVVIAVTLVFATIVASANLASSAGELVHTVAGPANLQLRARSGEGFSERSLARIEHLPAVKQAAPMLEQTATIIGPRGRRLTVNLAGADARLVVLDGLAHTLPIATLSPGGIGLSRTSAAALGVTESKASTTQVSLLLRGRLQRLNVSAVLGPEAFGSLAQASVAVMPLTQLQRLAGLPGRVSRILVQAKPGKLAAARRELGAYAGTEASIEPADQDLTALHEALRPSGQASGFFAAISVLLSLMFAFNALLLTVPERRRALADLRLIGARRTAIVQMFFFQAVCLGVAASAIGLACGYALSVGVLHQSSRYLAEAFTLGTRTVVGTRPLELSLAAGLLATCMASAVPLLDLRRRGALDAVYMEVSPPLEGAGDALASGAQARLALGAGALVAIATLLYALAPRLALLACALLALATLLAVPLALAAVLRGAAALAERYRLTVLPVAVASLRATRMRSLALAATGAVALFGSVALGGSRDDLLRGISGFARSYAADADIWVATPGDNQATVQFAVGTDAARIANLPGVASVHIFQGGFLQLGDRSVWIIARPPGAARQVLESQLSSGSASVALRRLAQGGWIALSNQIAEERHLQMGDSLLLPTPSGPAPFRIAATTTNLAWSPGAIFMGSADYRRLWRSSSATALAVSLRTDARPVDVRAEIERALGPSSGLEVTSGHARAAQIDALANEGLGQLGEISKLLLGAAVLAMAAALTSAIWQRRSSLAALRLSGVSPARLRLIIGLESTLLLSAGCVTGALAGIYGQVVIDGYLQHVTGFPVEALGATLRPLEILVVVIVIVLGAVAVPAWIASRVAPALAAGD